MIVILNLLIVFLMKLVVIHVNVVLDLKVMVENVLILTNVLLVLLLALNMLLVVILKDRTNVIAMQALNVKDLIVSILMSVQFILIIVHLVILPIVSIRLDLLIVDAKKDSKVMVASVKTPRNHS